MLDFGWAELMVIGIVLIFIIGPQDIPKIMLGLGRIVRRLTYMKYAVGQQFDQMMGNVDPHEVNNTVMRAQYQEPVPVVNAEEEGEAAEDDDYQPEHVLEPVADEDPLLKAQQDLFVDGQPDDGDSK